MKKRNLLLFTMVSLLTFGLAACNNTPASSSSSSSSSVVSSTGSASSSSSTSSATSASSSTSSPSSTSSSVVHEVAIEISNKEALTAEWHAREEDRRIEVAIKVDGSEIEFNLNSLISSGELVISSSDSKVLLVNGKILSPVGVGSVTLSVSYQGKTDSVAIEILGAKSEPARKVATLAEIFDADDTKGKTAYVTSGVVSRAYYDDGFGSAGRFYVTDGVTDTEYLVYNCAVDAGALTYDLSSETYKLTYMSDFKTNEQTKDIKVGTKIDFVAKRADYNTTKEVNALLLTVDGKPVYNATKTVAELNTIEANTKELYKVSGTIKSWQNSSKTDATKYGNFYLTDDSGQDILVYGASSTSTALKVDSTSGEWTFSNPQDFLTSAATKDLKIGDAVTLVGYRLNYNTTIEFTGVVLTNSDQPEPDPEPEEPVVTVTKTVAEAQASEAGTSVEVKGVVKAVTAKSFLIADGNGAKDNIVVWLNASHEYKVGDYVKVTGALASRNGNMQFDSTAKVEVLTDAAPTIEDSAVSWSATELDAFISTTADERGMDLISFTGKLSVSGNYYNVVVDGTNNQFSLSYVTDEVKAKLTSGNSYTFTGYIVDVSSSKYGNVYVTDIAELTFSPVESVAIDGEKTVELAVGQSLNLKATVSPASAKQDVTWASSKEDVATVENGKVTAVAEGTAVITVSSVGLNASEAVVTDTVTVTVKSATPGETVLNDTISYTNSSGKEVDGGFNFGDNLFDVINLKADANNAPVNKYDDIRIYQGHTLTFTAKDSSYKISKIEFKYAGSKYGALSAVSGVTSAGEALDVSKVQFGDQGSGAGFEVTFDETVSSITFTAAAQVRFTGFVVYYTAA